MNITRMNVKFASQLNVMLVHESHLYKKLFGTAYVNIRYHHLFTMQSTINSNKRSNSSQTSYRIQKTIDTLFILHNHGSPGNLQSINRMKTSFISLPLRILQCWRVKTDNSNTTMYSVRDGNTNRIHCPVYPSNEKQNRTMVNGIHLCGTDSDRSTLHCAHKTKEGTSGITMALLSIL